MDFTGTGSLVRLAVRRDRISSVAWTLVFVLMAASSAGAVINLYNTPESLATAASGVNDAPSLIALYGPIYDPQSLGAVAMFKLGVLGGALVGVFAAMLMVRHTRGEEEAGRLELIGSTVVGRHAPLFAALLVTIGTVTGLGLLTSLALIAAGLPAAGSLAFGLAWASIGIAFAGAAAIAAQLTTSARAATGLTMVFLGVAYVLRAVADTGNGSTEFLRWLSPIGWGQQVRAYQGNRWWVLLLPLAFTVAAAFVANALLARRDHGAGLLPDRPGPADAKPRLGTALGLAWRLQRGVFYGWLAAFLFLGLLFGNIATSVGNFLDSPNAVDMIQKLGGVHNLTDAFISTELGFMGIFAAAYGISAVLRLRSEESELRAEPVLATGVGRIQYAFSHLTVALLGTTVLTLGAGLAAGASYSAQTGAGADFGRVLVATLVRLPAAWVLVGIAALLFGLTPRLGYVAWVALVAFLLLGELGPMMKLSQAVMDVSPYAHVPRLPGGTFEASPVIALVLVAAALIAAGVAAFRRRDVPVT
jgi:polyether ionophore transport system permease protein